MRMKFVPIERSRIKAGEQDGLEAGQILFYPSVFGNLDSMRERVMPGAFTDTLKDWQASGDPLPIIFSHQWTVPEAHIGYALDVKQDDHGLLVHGQLDIEDNPTAMRVYKLMKGRRITQASFAYDVEEYEDADDKADDDDDWFWPAVNLTKLKLFEVGPCLIGANQETEILTVKSEPLMTPRRLARMKGAIPASAGPSGTTDEAWDAAANEANLSNDAGASTYRKMYAWVDPEGDPDSKSAYKFPHHMVSSDGTVGKANTRAASSAIAALNGGRGGASIPDDDRKSVHSHLSKHIRDGGGEPPELNAGSAQRSARARLQLAQLLG